MKISKSDGFADPVVLGIIAACIIIGSITVAVTKKPDTPVEQAAEAVLRAKGLDVDFSAGIKETDEQSVP